MAISVSGASVSMFFNKKIMGRTISMGETILERENCTRSVVLERKQRPPNAHTAHSLATADKRKIIYVGAAEVERHTRRLPTSVKSLIA